MSAGWLRRFGVPSANYQGTRPAHHRACGPAHAAALKSLCAALARAAETRGVEAPPRISSGAQLLCLQAALCKDAPLLRLDVRCVRRLQLRQARTDGRSQRPLCAHHRRPGQNRLSGLPQTAAGRRACDRDHALSRRCQSIGIRRSRLQPAFANACRYMASICGTPRASSCSRGSWSSDCRGSTTFSITRARPCVGRQVSSSTFLPRKAVSLDALPRPGGLRSRVMMSCGGASRDRRARANGRRPGRNRQRGAARRGTAAQRGALAAALSR